MKKMILVLAALALFGGDLAAQQLSDRQKRQFVGFAISRAYNSIDEIEEMIARLMTVQEALTHDIDNPSGVQVDTVVVRDTVFVTDTVFIPVDTVIPPDTTIPPNPDPPSGDVHFVRDWNDYSSTAEMIAANTNGFSLGEVELVTGQTLPDGSSGNVMRSWYRGNGEQDANYDIAFPPAQELWIELWIRFDPSWGGTSDDKTFFLWPHNGSRWEIHYGLGQRIYGGPSGMPGDFFIASDDGIRLDVDDVWDGEWQRIRLHVKADNPGTFAWWHGDQELVGPNIPSMWSNDYFGGEGINTGMSGPDVFHGMRLGANADPQGDVYRDWGPIRMYTEDPGWN